jgi:RNA recognition motif-containing protein
MKIYVGNLSFGTTEDALREQFSEYGKVGEVAIVTDRDTGRSRGFAFVTMNSDDEARQAIENLNGTQLDGRALVVNEARPRERDQGPSRRRY